MIHFLVDTNVISEFVKPQPERRVIEWLDAADPASLFASVVTFSELRLGIEALPPGNRRRKLEDWIENGLPSWFDSNLLPITKPIADHWGRLTIAAKKKGLNLTTADGQIAASALANNLTLVTRNTNEFVGLGLPLFNPWKSE